MTSWRSTMALLLLVPSVALAACGGSDKSSSAGTTSTSPRGYSGALTAGEFAKQGTAICQDAAKQVAANQSANAKDPVALVTKQDAISTAAAKRYRALTPPPEFAKEWPSFLASQDKGLAVSKDLVALTKDQKNAELIARVDKENTEVAALAPKLAALSAHFGWDCQA